MKRFQDSGEHLSDFSEYRIIACPNCGKPINLIHAKISCRHCGHIEDRSSGYHNGQLEDFLKIPCGGNQLHFLNLEHLIFLEQYVASDLRERMPNVNKSLISRLPQWIKSAKNRNEILKCINRLKKLLEENGYEPPLET